MLKQAKKWIVLGLVILAGILLLILIFQFRPVDGDQKDLAMVEDMATYTVQPDKFRADMEAVKKNAEADANAAGISADMSSFKLNPAVYNAGEQKCWLRILEIANSFCNSKTLGYPGNGMFVMADAINETSIPRCTSEPVAAVPDSFLEKSGVLTVDMINKVGICDFLSSGANIANRDAGDIGILQNSNGHTAITDKKKASGCEYDKVTAAKLQDKAAALSYMSTNLLNGFKEFKDKGGAYDRFNWADCCNSFANECNSVLATVPKKKGLKVSNQYAAMFYCAQYHNQSATINTSTGVNDTGYYSASLGKKANVYIMCNQMNDASIIAKAKADATATVKSSRPNKAVPKPSWKCMAEKWKSFGFVFPSDVDQTDSHALYALTTVYYYMELEAIYSGN